MEKETLSHEKDNLRILKESLKRTSFYHLDQNQNFKEITKYVLSSSETDPSIRKLIRSTGRRICIFRYPSESFKIIGFISFIPTNTKSPLMIYLRGGNRLFGLPHPAHDLTCCKDYVVVGTTYRGGINDGVDEFGGADLNDVKSLVEYFPQLETLSGLALQERPLYCLGASRGGMQMLLALAQFPEFQKRVKKAICLSGIVDMRLHLEMRQDMEALFVRDFGLSEANRETWINQRNCILAVENIRHDLPILVVQGTKDWRVPILEGHHLVKKFQLCGHLITYWELEGQEHCLKNDPHRINLIIKWLENPETGNPRKLKTLN